MTGQPRRGQRTRATGREFRQRASGRESDCRRRSRYRIVSAAGSNSSAQRAHRPFGLRGPRPPPAPWTRSGPASGGSSSRRTSGLPLANTIGCPCDRGSSNRAWRHHPLAQTSRRARTPGSSRFALGEWRSLVVNQFRLTHSVKCLQQWHPTRSTLRGPPGDSDDRRHRTCAAWLPLSALRCATRRMVVADRLAANGRRRMRARAHPEACR